jgi:2-oxoglutarate/2-oxoacid ferredoxin oxidoreductase subunit beta
MKEEYRLKASDFNTERKPTWCRGCGDYTIWYALKKVFVELELYPHQIIMVYGTGCSGNGVNFLKTYGFRSMRGRALPIAAGSKLAAHRMTVIAVSGNGDAMGAGGNHFIHTCRRNINITCILADNRVYGLAGGRASPTGINSYKEGPVTRGTPVQPINPVSLAIAAGATFIARGFSGDPGQLKEILKKAIRHRGFSFVDVLAPCITFSMVDTYKYYREKIYRLEEIKSYDRSEKVGAFEKSLENDRLPTGIFYKVEKPVYEDGLKQIERKPLIDHIISDIDINKLLSRYY